MFNKNITFAFLAFLSFCSQISAQSSSQKTFEVTYGRKDGMALTMVVQKPDTLSNGKGIIWVISAGWTSDYNWIPMFKGLLKPVLDRGYTLFYVMHGSQPKYTVPDAIADLRRAIRFIRYHASDYGIDPSKIGISGGSAGGHLSLMAGTTGDDGNPNSNDVVERTSSRIQAVACFYPPVDFLNWKSEGDNAVLHSTMKEFQAPLDFTVWNPVTNHYIAVTDSVKRTETGRKISPYYEVTPDDAPILIVHGDNDLLVPLSQSQKMIGKLKEAGVPCNLIIKPGAGHGFWKDMTDYTKLFADWFDKYLQ
jgi:acetyl esterase/lipase